MANSKTNIDRKQSGSALTEFVVVSTVLIPVMFGIPMIGKMIDLKQTTVQASRYSAWETTVSDQGVTAQHLDQRFFSDASAPIGAADVGPNKLWGPVEEPVVGNDAAANANANGTQANGNAQGDDPLSSYFSDTAIVVTTGAVATTPSAYDTGMKGSVEYAPAADYGAAYRSGQGVAALGVISDKSGGDWSMQTDGLIRGEASVDIQSNSWLGPQTITQGTVIMNDNWSVEDATAARDRVRSLVPAGVLDEVGIFMGVLGEVPMLNELKPFKDDGGRRVFGYVDMEPLPPSETGTRRLKEYGE